MTALIKLTILHTHGLQEEKEVYINPAQITQFYGGFNENGGTFVALVDGSAKVVKESPEEIVGLIWKAENVKCKL